MEYDYDEIKKILDGTSSDKSLEMQAISENMPQN